MGSGPWALAPLCPKDLIPLRDCENVTPGQNRATTYAPFNSTLLIGPGVVTLWCQEGCEDRLWALSLVHVLKTLNNPPSELGGDPATTMVTFNSATDVCFFQVDPWYTRFLPNKTGETRIRPLTFPSSPRQVHIGDSVYVIRGQNKPPLHYRITSTVDSKSWLYEPVGAATIPGNSGCLVVLPCGLPVALHQSNLSCVPLSAISLAGNLHGRPVIPVPTGTWTQMVETTRELSTLLLKQQAQLSALQAGTLAMQDIEGAVIVPEGAPYDP